MEVMLPTILFYIKHQNLTIPFTAPCIKENIGNKQCEAAQNHAACEYDGGDCCLHWGRYASSNTKDIYTYNKDINAFLDYNVLVELNLCLTGTISTIHDMF